jgi:hypothetical protein
LCGGISNKLILLCRNLLLMMNTVRKLPIGVQDFEKLRKENCLYVDKTQYVYQLAQTVSP